MEFGLLAASRQERVASVGENQGGNRVRCEIEIGQSPWRLVHNVNIGGLRGPAGGYVLRSE